MKFFGSSGSLALALLVAVGIQLSLATSPDARLSDGICGISCDPNSVHGCKGTCHICDPENRKCVRPNKGDVSKPTPPPATAKPTRPPATTKPTRPPATTKPTPPPATTKPPILSPQQICQQIFNNSPQHASSSTAATKCFAKNKSWTRSVWLYDNVPEGCRGSVGRLARIELTDKRRDIYYQKTLFKYPPSYGWVLAEWLDIESGGPEWCKDN